MNAHTIRQQFLDFFKSKGHTIVPSAPMVVKNDPSLMFNNSGMAPFKDQFLGHAPILHSRIADTQKCLRVSGKHNDLEEVGVDTYHHTMFEMLGNWSFGDYFKTEAIAWSWELLTKVYGINPDRLYVTVFEGALDDNIPFDTQAYNEWLKWIPQERILKGSKKDNFWEMGETGPCGPCSEIHYDGRSDTERHTLSGTQLVNADHPQVIEIWNNVFMEYERKANGQLVALPKKHVDTGMGFERLVRVLQGKNSNYDTDVFQPLIQKIEELSGLRYSATDEHLHKSKQVVNIGMRVIADHIRTIAFSIADGQLPGNTGAGYVIRRILRRAVRYGYQSLNLKEPFLFRMVPVLAMQMGKPFPELQNQKLLIERVIREEELAFYKTLENGLKRIDQICAEAISSHKQQIDGAMAFELYDTFGFPLDLTALIARGYNLNLDEAGFEAALEIQKQRSRKATATEASDWIYNTEAYDASAAVRFVGYTEFETTTRIRCYRKQKVKQSTVFQIVLDNTPFYAESGGQIGDSGTIEIGGECIQVLDTRKENGIPIHFVDRLPQQPELECIARINNIKRADTARNHSATHLLHAALRRILGPHVEQKGSLVHPDYLRFDFSHFSKISAEELQHIETLVNDTIKQHLNSEITEMALKDAKTLGAMALFGEKYGEFVRVVRFDSSFSIELCGGTHVKNTSEIGFFKIQSESAVAAGIRRIEATTGRATEQWLQHELTLLNQIREQFKSPKDLFKSILQLGEEKLQQQKELEQVYIEFCKYKKEELNTQIKTSATGTRYIICRLDFNSPEALKSLLFQLREEQQLICIVAGIVRKKPSISIIISDELCSQFQLNAANWIRQLAVHIKGGGGGQTFYAQAGGTDASGLDAVLKSAELLIP
jgi:alanyl-tRNA synthetase